MREMTIASTKINDSSKAYVIAEIGHNHQGKIDSALDLIRMAADAGASAVKFQKRSNAKLFIPELFNQPYNSENSFGDTYGNHRQALEFGAEEYRLCQAESMRIGIDFFATAFDFESADFLSELHVPAFKVASGDLPNIPLLQYIARFNKPMIISTGGSTFSMIARAMEAINRFHNEVAILQCTASYPAEYNQLNLRVIEKLRDLYPNNVIGFSGHDNGIAMSTVAFSLGARIIEKHFTLNRALKGTDHAFSLEPQGLKKLVRDLNRASLALGDGNKEIYETEKLPLKKMGKMIVVARNLKAGHKLTFNDLEFRSPANGISPYFFEEVVGKILIKDFVALEPLDWAWLK